MTLTLASFINMASWPDILCAVIAALIAYASPWTLLLLCGLLFFSHVYLKRRTSESTTQTEMFQEPDQRESETDPVECYDEPDTVTTTVPKTLCQLRDNDVHVALEKLFICAYSHLVLPWYNVPEERENQPLYGALLTEFNLVADQIILKAKDLDLVDTCLGCIQIITKHLHSAKQSNGTQAFNSAGEEMALLRTFSDAIIQNLLPQHLWKTNLYYCAVQEILAIQVRSLVTLLSDPDKINLIVCPMDQEPLPMVEEEAKEVNDSDSEDKPYTVCTENNENLQVEENSPSGEGKTEDTPKSKSAKQPFKKMWKYFGMSKKSKSKKKKKIEDQVNPSSDRRPAAFQSEIRSLDSICTDDESDLECDSGEPQQEKIQFELSYEMWQVGEWTVTVKAKEKRDLCFTIVIKEKNNPENLHWNVNKTKLDIVQFCQRYKDKAHLSSISILDENSSTEVTEEEARKLECFLQALVKDEQLGNSEDVFRFLYNIQSENDQSSVLNFLNGIASFLNAQLEDFESDLAEEEMSDDVTAVRDVFENIQQEKLDEAQSLCIDTLNKQNMGDDEDDDDNDDDDDDDIETDSVPTTIRTSCTRQEDFHPPRLLDLSEQSEGMKNIPTEATLYSQSERTSTEKNVGRRPAAAKHTTQGNSFTGKIPSPATRMKKDPKSSILKPKINTVIFDLLKEISDNSHLLKFFKTILKPFTQLIDKQVLKIFKKLNRSEADVASYIDMIRESVWPDSGEPQELPRSKDQIHETQQKALQFLISKFSRYPFLSEGKVKNTFRIFQNVEENKKLLYMLLSYLQKEFLSDKLAVDGRRDDETQ